MHNINKLKYPGIIKELYQKYYLDAQRPDGQYSSHWKKYSNLCKVSINKQGYIRTIGCGFGDLYYKRPWCRAASVLTIYSYLKRMRDNGDLRKLIKLSKNVLRKISAYMSYDAFRQLCALSVVRKYLSFNPEDSFNMLIIGDGYGFLSAMIRTLYPNSRIVLVDIGTTLLFQALNLQTAFPNATHALISSERIAETDFVYCGAEDIDLIDGRIFNLIINISSMQEMRMEIVNAYFAFIRRVALQDNIFYCSNREVKVLVGGEKIEYSKYPWQKDDKILLDESPAFYRYYYQHKYPFKIYFEPMRHRVVRMALR